MGTNHGPSDSLARKPFFEVPNQIERYFDGRSITLLEIETALHQGDAHRPRIVMLHGPGGRGKTQIALKYCERQRSKVGASATDIFWVEATTRSSRLKGLSLLYYRFRIPQHQMNDEDRAQSVIRHLATSDLNWLLVYDGFGDGRSSVSPTSVRECIPNSDNPYSTIIITTRSESCKELFQEFIDADFEIGGLDSIDGATLLLKRSGIEQTPASVIEAEKTAVRLEGSPPNVIRAAKDLATMINIVGKRDIELLQFSASFRSRVAALPGLSSAREDASTADALPPTTIDRSTRSVPDGQRGTIEAATSLTEPSTYFNVEATLAERSHKENSARQERAKLPEISFLYGTGSGPAAGKASQFAYHTVSDLSTDSVRWAIIDLLLRVLHFATPDDGLPQMQNAFSQTSNKDVTRTAHLFKEGQSMREFILSIANLRNELPSTPAQADAELVALCLQADQVEGALDQAKHNMALVQTSLKEAHTSIDGLQSRVNDSLIREQGLSDSLREANAKTDRLARLLKEYGIEDTT